LQEKGERGGRGRRNPPSPGVTLQSPQSTEKGRKKFGKKKGISGTVFSKFCFKGKCKIQENNFKFPPTSPRHGPWAGGKREKKRKSGKGGEGGGRGPRSRRKLGGLCPPRGSGGEKKKKSVKRKEEGEGTSFLSITFFPLTAPQMQRSRKKKEEEKGKTRICASPFPYVCLKPAERLGEGKGKGTLGKRKKGGRAAISSWRPGPIRPVLERGLKKKGRYRVFAEFPCIHMPTRGKRGGGGKKAERRASNTIIAPFRFCSMDERGEEKGGEILGEKRGEKKRCGASCSG